jgi:hypothetical protein
MEHSMTSHQAWRALIAGAIVAATAAPVGAQGGASRPQGRVSVTLNSVDRAFDDGTRRRDTEMSTGLTFKIPDVDTDGADVGLDLRYSRYAGIDRPARVSVYDAFAGVRFGGDGRFRVRAGHMWLTDLGTTGALAGGLFEYRQPAAEDSTRVRAGVFTGLEPALYDLGYAPEVRKHGAYVAVEKGFLRRHVVGYTRVRQGSLTERSVVSVTNFVPAGERVFVYQAAELDVEGPAGGTARRGLSYLLANVRVTPAERLELLGTYNRGHALDARRLAEDVLNGRPLTQQAVDGLRYESAGGRVTVEVLPRVRVYAGYSRDRNNRDDAPTGRTLLGGHAANLFGSGVDLSASDSRVDRPGGAYHSQYFSVGRSLGRALYVSGDYSTSLSVIRFLRGDGLIIETRPSTRRYSGTASATLTRSTSLLLTADYSRDDALTDLRILTSLSYRLR